MRMSSLRSKCLGGILAVVVECLFNSFCFARSSSYSEVGFDYPADGGGLVSYSRMWRVLSYLDVGYMVGGGQVKNEFDVPGPTASKLHVQTTSLLLPYIGPRMTLVTPVVGLTLGYGAFYSLTDFTASNEAYHFSGRAKGWGQGVYSPFLVLDFYDSKRDLIFGFGLGGLFATSYPEMTSTVNGTTLTINQSPFDTLTFHIDVRWPNGRSTSQRRPNPSDNEL
jgi:hypothetical protein